MICYIDGEEVTNREKTFFAFNADFNSEDTDLMIGMFVQH